MIIIVAATNRSLLNISICCPGGFEHWILTQVSRVQNLASLIIIAKATFSCFDEGIMKNSNFIRLLLVTSEYLFLFLSKWDFFKCFCDMAEIAEILKVLYEKYSLHKRFFLVRMPALSSTAMPSKKCILHFEHSFRWHAKAVHIQS